MSKYFVLPEEGIGPGGDIVWRRSKGHGEGWYKLYLVNPPYKKIPEQFLGFVTKDRLGYWTAISWGKKPSEFLISMMEGFGNRWYASQYVIKHHGYWMRNERERRERLCNV